MVHYDKNDPAITRLAAVIAKRYDGELTLELDTKLDEYCGKICGSVVSAGSHAQLWETAGRFLRNPGIGDQKFHSQKKFSGIYFATHFNNYLDAAPLEEICRYIDDLALWGMNVLKVWFDMHHFVNMEDGKKTSDRLLAVMQYAKSIGIKIFLGLLSNEAFDGSPEELRADWTEGHDGYIHPLNDHYHLEICPSKPGGMEQILAYRREMLEVFGAAKPDYVSFGAYDEGGCTCSRCAPWGANGYIRTCERLIPLVREYMPDAEIIMSLWQFGTFTGNDVEFEGMKKALEEGRLPEVRYLVAEPQYAAYPFEKGMPRPLINFPEISMFQASPWGGYGANPMPRLLNRLWEANKDKLEGGIPYSEGLYEDMNKVIMLRLYRDSQPAEVTVREYLASEFGFGGDMLEKVCGAVLDMEETLERSFDKEIHRYVIARPEKVLQIEKSMREAHASLSEEMQKNKKWQMLYLRALIDGELSRNDFYRNDTVKSYFYRLIDLEHLHRSGKWTKPDVEE